MIDHISSFVISFLSHFFVNDSSYNYYYLAFFFHQSSFIDLLSFDAIPSVFTIWLMDLIYLMIIFVQGFQRYLAYYCCVYLEQKVPFVDFENLTLLIFRNPFFYDFFLLIQSNYDCSFCYHSNFNWAVFFDVLFMLMSDLRSLQHFFQLLAYDCIFWYFLCAEVYPKKYWHDSVHSLSFLKINYWWLQIHQLSQSPFT